MEAIPGLARNARLLLAAALALLAAPLPGQDAEAEARFAAESLRHRTALHHDPLVEAPLEALVKLYLEAGRAEELVALYRNHVASYPEDAGAKTVLVRLLRRTDRAGAEELLAEAVPRHPDYAPLHYVLFRTYEERGDARAAEALSRAIGLESDASRRNGWLEELLSLAEGESARALGKAQLAAALAVANLDGPSLLGLGRLAQRHRFWEESVAALDRAKAATKDAETAVEIDLMLATAFAQLQRREQAGALLDALLGRLAADHWRRREILSLRLGALASGEERKSYLASLEAAAKARADDEGARLDYAEALVAAERKTEASQELADAAARLPSSKLLETRALELFESSGDLESLASFLEGRLEGDPGRLDLRFRLVKAEYAMRRDADAGQDFRTVVAGLPPEEVSGKLLELQRYLRGIDRADAAAPYLEEYVRDHPARLDVARELAEVRIAGGAAASVGELARSLRPEEADASEVLDFAEFLLASGLAQPARTLVEAKLAAEPRQFELGLQLVEILGRIGDASAVKERSASLREMADTAPRYRRWLASAIGAHRLLETLPGFLDSEWNRYDFDDGSWPEEKVEKFLILCEQGKRELVTGRIAEGLREQLAQAGLEAGLRLRLRKALVAVLTPDPAAAGEVEEQLKLLATEDPANRSEHDLRRALVHHRNERHDLARPLLAGVDFAGIGNASLLRQAADALVEDGFLKEAEKALATVTALEPGDLLSWELRLSVLAAMGEESALRALQRGLRSGDKGVELREQSLRALQDHLEASYWRSVVALLGSDRLAETLPLLAAVDQEDLPERSRLWTDWTRIRVLARLGREAEAGEALSRLRERAAARKIGTIAFPDGLELDLATAARVWSDARRGEDAEAGPGAAFLLENPVLRWAFELPEGAELLRLERTGRHVLVLDDRHWMHGLDVASGKLLWRGPFGESGAAEAAASPLSFAAAIDGTERTAGADPGDPGLAARIPPRLLVSGERFFLMKGRECFAFSAADGSVAWTAPLPERAGEGAAAPLPGRASPGTLLALSEGRVVLFDPVSGDLLGVEEATGKRLWHKRLGTGGGSAAEVASLTAGLELSGGLGFAFGTESVVFDAASGEVVWRFREEDTVRFPVVLRPPREEEIVAAAAPAADPGAPLSRFPLRAPGASGAGVPDSFFDGPSALLGGAVYWSGNRTRRGETSAAAIGDGFLWLMQGGAARRLSDDLPLASRELPAAGTFLGVTGDHAWFLDGDSLLHLDFHRGRSGKLRIGDLGAPSEVRATLAGNQVVVRGNASLALVNAVTGEILGRALLPASLAGYLAATLPGKDGDGEIRRVWQGRVRRSGPGRPPRCLPVGDVIDQGACLAAFGDRVVACLEPSPAPGTAVPPAPTRQ